LWDILRLRTGKTGTLQQLLHRSGSQVRDEQKQTAKTGSEVPRVQVEFALVADLCGSRPSSAGPFLIFAPRQASKAFLFKDLRDGGGTEFSPLMFQCSADIIDREVLLAQGNDLITNTIGFRSALDPLLG
jgi:hypothetical protein